MWSVGWWQPDVLASASHMQPALTCCRVAARCTHTCQPGRAPRPQLLRDLWRAQHPPGRLSRMLPRLQRLLAQTLTTVSLMAVGFAVGQAAQRRWSEAPESA